MEAEQIELTISSFGTLAKNILEGRENDPNWNVSLKSIKVIKQEWLFQFREKCIKTFIERYMYVSNISTLDLLHDQVAIRAICRPSMQAGSKWVCIVLSKEKILDAYCKCASGLSKVCHHMGALFLTIFDFKQQKLDAVPSKRTRTDLLCQWIQPSRTANAGSGKRISNMKFKNHKQGKQSKGKLVSRESAIRLPRIFTPVEESIQQLAGFIKAFDSSSPFMTEALVRKRLVEMEKNPVEVIATPAQLPACPSTSIHSQQMCSKVSDSGFDESQ